MQGTRASKVNGAVFKPATGRANQILFVFDCPCLRQCKIWRAKPFQGIDPTLPAAVSCDKGLDFGSSAATPVTP